MRLLTKKELYVLEFIDVLKYYEAYFVTERNIKLLRVSFLVEKFNEQELEDLLYRYFDCSAHYKDYFSYFHEDTIELFPEKMRLVIRKLKQKYETAN